MACMMSAPAGRFLESLMQTDANLEDPETHRTVCGDNGKNVTLAPASESMCHDMNFGLTLPKLGLGL